MPLILGANSVSGGYNVANSLRFNSGSTDYLSKNSWATATSDKIFTYSTWVKRSQLANTERLFGAYAGSPQVYSCDLSFTSNNGYIEFTFGGASAYDIVTNAMFRDISAWYHVILAVDTTQATNTNRIKIYVNNTLQTLQTANYPPQNTTYQVFRNNNANLIGSAWNGGSYYTGYMSEVYFIDGQALDPTSFGETDFDSGIWKPIPYTGSFGTNGFYLQFKNSGSLGLDSSGNANNFTVNNLTSVDQSTDTCTNNFATFLTLNDWNGKSSSQPTISEGNLKFSGSGGWFGEQVSSIAISTGKWYWEITPTTVGLSNLTFGIVNTNNINEIGTRTGSYGYASSGEKWNGSTNTAYGATWTANDVIGVAFDAINGTLAFYKNGTSQGNAFTGITSTSYNAWFMTYNSVGTVNFGSPVVSSNGYTDGAGFGNFSYAVPAGYFALCSKNLAEYA